MQRLQLTCCQEHINFILQCRVPGGGSRLQAEVYVQGLASTALCSGIQHLGSNLLHQIFDLSSRVSSFWTVSALRRLDKSRNTRSHPSQDLSHVDNKTKHMNREHLRQNTFKPLNPEPLDEKRRADCATPPLKRVEGYH